jgi:hypothetical protein
MDLPPEVKMRTPTWGKVGGAVVSKGLAVQENYSTQPQNAIVVAVRCVRSAGHLLREATYRLDDGGYRCDELNDLAADTTALAASWAGRPVPSTPEAFPAFVIEAAREWRRLKRRSY